MSMKSATLAITAWFAMGVLGIASANPITSGPNLVQNGDFSQTNCASAGVPHDASVASACDQNDKLSGSWQSANSNFKVDDWTASGLNAQGQRNSSGLAIWFPNVSGAFFGPHTNPWVGLWPDQAGTGAGQHDPTLPSGATSFIGLDSDPKIATMVSQQLTGLTVGQYYVLTFDWAAAQQNGVSGPTTDQLRIDLGDKQFSTQTLGIDSHGFSGWYSESFGFYADSDSALLSFLAMGTPTGYPPFVLLSDVGVHVTPEPSALGLFGAGLLGLGALVLVARRRALRHRHDAA